MLVSTPGRQAGVKTITKYMGQRHLMSAADERTTAVGFWDFFWLMLWGYVFIAYLMVLFQVIMDVFRDRSINGWTRVIWLIALFIAPPVTALIYLIARGKGMGERQRQVASDSRAAAEQYVRSIAGATDPAESIQRAKALLDSGAISAAEYETLKAKALSS
ncbi:MAG TPA: SHOCT domain-containing protein [Propionicimonas sp.]|jgi:hypothetical protein